MITFCAVFLATPYATTETAVYKTNTFSWNCNAIPGNQAS